MATVHYCWRSEHHRWRQYRYVLARPGFQVLVINWKSFLKSRVCPGFSFVHSRRPHLYSQPTSDAVAHSEHRIMVKHLVFILLILACLLQGGCIYLPPQVAAELEPDD